MLFTSAYLLLACSCASALPSNPFRSLQSHSFAVEGRSAEPESEIASPAEPWLKERDSEDVWERDDTTLYASLEKRRGGGGHGSSGGGGKGGSSSGSSGGSTGGKGSSGSSSAPKSFGGGTRYAGGSSTAYRSGGRSPGGISPVLLGGGIGLGLGAAAVYSYGYYGYPYHTTYPYHNSTTNKDQNLPVECFCQKYDACGCDDSGNSTDVAQMVKNGSVASIKVVNGTRKVIVNGTLANGTASGAGGVAGLLNQSLTGYWVSAAIVITMVWGL